MRVVILMLLIFVAGCDRQSSSPEQAEPAKIEGTGASIDRSYAGTMMPDLTLTGPDGKPRAIRTLIGKPVLVNLWATWCVPCITEMPTLDALQASRGEALAVIPISQDQQPERVAPFWKKRSYKSIKPWLDPEAQMSAAINGGSLPLSIYFDASGKEVWRVIGDLDWQGNQAKALLDEPLNPAKAR